jgi:membrane associated rhomboid family serine protease
MRYDQISPVPPLTKVTKALIIACTVTYFVEFVLSHLGLRLGEWPISEVFGLVPGWILSDWKFSYQFVTYLFLHGHPFHLLMNMLILWYFGAEIEMRLGEKGFLFYFFLCGIGAGVFNFLVNISFFDGQNLMSPIIGASGAIYGILAAYGIFYGDRYFLVFFLIPLQARWFVLVIAAIELIMGVEGSPKDNVAHFAHLGGMAIGAAYIWLRFVLPKGGKGSGPKRDREKEALKKKFTLIVNENGDGISTKEGDGGPNYWN